MKEISSDDLNRIFHRNPHYGGVFSKDEIPQLKNKFYVINMSDHDKDGTHWVLIDNVGKNCIYFDSFGAFPPQFALSRMSQTGKDIIHNTNIIQAFNSDNCGWYVISMAQLLETGNDFDDLCQHFTEKRHDNEQWIQNYSQRYIIPHLMG